MVFKKPQPIDPLDQLEADGAEDRREDAADKMADAEIDSARKACDKILNDPDTRAAAAPDDIERALARLRTAKDLKVKTSTTLAAGRLKRGDLKARGQILGQEGRYAKAQCADGANQKDMAVFLRGISEATGASARMDQRRLAALAQQPEAEVLPDGRMIEKAYGLVDVGFPEGFLSPVSTAVEVRSAWADHVLPAVARKYPQILVEVIGEQGSAIIAKVQADDAAKKPRWYAVGCPSWNVYPGRKLGS